MPAKEIIDEAALYALLVATPTSTIYPDAWWVKVVQHGKFEMGHLFLDLPNVVDRLTSQLGLRRRLEERCECRAVENRVRSMWGERSWRLTGPRTGFSKSWRNDVELHVAAQVEIASHEAQVF